MPIARRVFQTGALLCAVVSIVACSRTDDAEVVTQAVIAEEVDVAAPAAESIVETESVSSILESIAAARDDIARGDAIDAESALGIALDLLATFATETNAPSMLDQPDAQRGLAEETLPLAETYALVKEARDHLRAGHLDAADGALERAHALAQMTPTPAAIEEAAAEQ